jgi:DNA polymerase-1
MYLAYLMDENRPAGLKDNADRYLGGGSEQSKDLGNLLVLWGLGKDEMWRLPASAVEPYACQDVRLPPLIIEHLKEKADTGTLAVWEELNDLLLVVFDMERVGIHCEAARMSEFSRECMENMRRLEIEMKKVFGHGFNPASPKVVAARLGLPDATEESIMSSKHPFAPLVVEHRAWNKALTTYYNKYRDVMDPHGNVHSSFKIHGTVTGRLSSRNPNMQAVPTWTPQQRVKEVFTAEEGRVLAELDYSQAEIRMAAHYTRDENLMNAVKSGRDIHQETANLTGLPRQAAKMLNFSVVYGAGAASLAPKLGVSESVAYDFLQKYHGAYPGFRDVSRVVERTARERGYISLYTGRRRHFNHPDAETRKGFSNLIQGGVGEMVRRAMVKAHPFVKGRAGFITNQVHDSLWLNLPQEGAEETILGVKKIMEDRQFAVPIVVDAKMGQDMKNMRKV